jgi:hypothetical protein
VHGDVRGVNVLINDEGRPLISDFSLSKVGAPQLYLPVGSSHPRADLGEPYRRFAHGGKWSKRVQVDSSGGGERGSATINTEERCVEFRDVHA